LEKTSRLGFRNSVASRVKCGLHGGKNCKTKSWTISWFSLKIKVEAEDRAWLSGQNWPDQFGKPV
jgi:hypothetical protein